MNTARIFAALRGVVFVALGAVAVAQVPSNQPPDQNRRPVPNISFEQILARESADHDGVVTRTEFKGPPPLFDALDRDGDGKLTAKDFAEARPSAPTASPQQ